MRLLRGNDVEDPKRTPARTVLQRGAAKVAPPKSFGRVRVGRVTRPWDRSLAWTTVVPTRTTAGSIPKLYEFEACPFCRKAREAVTALDLVVDVYPVGRGSRHRVRLSASTKTDAASAAFSLLPRVSPTKAVAAVAAVATGSGSDNAPSDGPNMVPLKDFEALVTNLIAFDTLAKSGTR